MKIEQAIHCFKKDYDEAGCDECSFYHNCTAGVRADAARLAVNTLEIMKAMKNARENANSRCCGTCLMFNGGLADGIQFCDELELWVDAKKFCNKWKQKH